MIMITLCERVARARGGGGGGGGGDVHIFDYVILEWPLINI